MSETASAQLHLVSTTGTAGSPVFNYDITLTDTGTTNLGTFWFAWVPGADLLPSAPLSANSPSGWGNAGGTPTITGSGNSADGSAIEWVAQSPAAALTPGQSLSGFAFSSHDSPAALAGMSPSHPTLPAETSFVFGGGPFSDAGQQFTVASVPATGAQAASRTTLLSSAATINAGDSVTFTATVSPAAQGGAGTTPTGIVSFIEAGNVIGAAALRGDGTAVFSTTALPAGSDSVTAQYAGDAAYAASTSAPVTETVNGTPAASTPPLTPAIIKSTLPAALVAGAPVHGVVSVSVSNPGSSPVKGSVTIALYASADGSIDGSAVLIAQLTRTLNLKPGKAAVVSIPVRSLPANLANGTYTLLARAIDPSSNAADSSAGPTVNIAAPFVALSESFTRLTLPATVTAGSKTRSIATLRITNAGNIAATGPTTIAIFASPDGAIDDRATPIQSITRTLRIQPGKSLVVSIPLALIPAIPAGPYSILAQVTAPDQQKSSADAGTTINIAAAPA